MQNHNGLQTDQTALLFPHTHTDKFTVQGRDDSREGSASSAPCAERVTLQRGGASVSTPLQSATDSPNLLKAPPTTATSATPASEQGSPFLGLSSGAEPAWGHAEIAEAVVDDVFSSVDEVLSAQDSTRKEFHCAVLRALSKEPSVAEAAEADQAPGTPDEVESCLKSGLPFPSSPAQPPPVSLHTAALGDVGIPACCVLSFFWGFEVCCCCFYLMKASSLPAVWSYKPLLDYFSTHPLSLMFCT